MTRDELQHLHDRYKQTGRYSHLLALANGVHRFLEQDDPTVEIAYLKAKVADLSRRAPDEMLTPVEDGTVCDIRDCVVKP